MVIGTPGSSTPTTPAAPESRPGVRLRTALDGLPTYVPGAGGANPGVYKLSSNEVPFPPLPGVLAAVADAVEDANRYPEIYADRLVAAVAAHHGVAPEQVLVGNGSVAVCGHVLAAACEPGDEIVYAWRSFEAYPILAQVAGAVSRQVPNLPDGSHDLDGMVAAINGRTRVLVLCTPNNPTGTAITQTELEGVLERVPSDVLVLLDEAYVHFDTSADPIDSVPLLPRYKNLLILRTFSKAYGMAGLRLGYAIARRRLVSRLRVSSTPFGVNALAQVAGAAALAQTELVTERVAVVVAERTRVLAALRGLGFAVPEPQGNFVWLPLGDASAAFAARAAAAGVVVRPFAGDGVRVTIGEDEANDLLLGVAAEWTRGPHGPDTSTVGGSPQS